MALHFREKYEGLLIFKDTIMDDYIVVDPQTNITFEERFSKMSFAKSFCREL